ncbi:unnamed protein product [Protopolystoma xenopodis]|uniref:Uncharacterized protein n=1 Tax=Protopolystoma xenopodis TaxID=117903 RepID=A0A3S5AU95_9PLAT|nr:unnamed protein product [Protopolystoma xenopodis]
MFSVCQFEGCLFFCPLVGLSRLLFGHVKRIMLHMSFESSCCFSDGRTASSPAYPFRPNGTTHFDVIHFSSFSPSTMSYLQHPPLRPPPTSASTSMQSMSCLLSSGLIDTSPHTLRLSVCLARDILHLNR